MSQNLCWGDHFGLVVVRVTRAPILRLLCILRASQVQQIRENKYGHGR